MHPAIIIGRSGIAIERPATAIGHSGIVIGRLVMNILSKSIVKNQKHKGENAHYRLIEVSRGKGEKDRSRSSSSGKVGKSEAVSTFPLLQGWITGKNSSIFNKKTKVAPP